MPRVVIELEIRPSFSNRLMTRLVESDGEFYLSCWSWPRHLRFDEMNSPTEDFMLAEVKNWQVPVERLEVKTWLQILEFQKISILPKEPNFQVRDGTSYRFSMFAEGHGCTTLHWHEELPSSWSTLSLIIERLQDLSNGEP